MCAPLPRPLPPRWRMDFSACPRKLQINVSNSLWVHILSNSFAWTVYIIMKIYLFFHTYLFCWEDHRAVSWICCDLFWSSPHKDQGPNELIMEYSPGFGGVAPAYVIKNCSMVTSSRVLTQILEGLIVELVPSIRARWGHSYNSLSKWVMLDGHKWGLGTSCTKLCKVMDNGFLYKVGQLILTLYFHNSSHEFLGLSRFCSFPFGVKCF